MMNSLKLISLDGNLKSGLVIECRLTSKETQSASLISSNPC